MNKIEYIAMGSWPVLVGFTDSKKAFNKLVKDIECQEHLGWMATSTAMATTHCFVDDEGTNAFIVTFDPDISVDALPSIISHEVWHVVEGIYEYLGEKKFGSEATAYLIQYLVESMYKGLVNGRTA
jgi:hypothetical protein